MEKKPHTGRTILLIVLAILLLIPVSLYCYLAFCGFHASELRAGYDPDAAYAGTVAFQPDGTVDVPLTQNDVYWIIDQYNVMHDWEASVGNLLQAYAVDFRAGGLVLYADARLFRFLPLPLKVSADAVCNGGTVDLTIQEIRLGKWINVPVEKLAGFGVEKEMSFDLNDLDFRSKITGVQFQQDRIIVSERFMKSFCQDALTAVHASGIAHTLYIYEGDPFLAENPMFSMVLGGDPAQNGPEVSSMDAVKAIAGAPDQQAALSALLSCISNEKLDAIISGLDAFEKHFIIGQAGVDSGGQRAALMERLASEQADCEGLLTALRTAYREKKLTLDGKGFLDEAGNPLTLAAAYPGAAFSEEGSRVMLILSNFAFHAVKTYDMPLLKDVPKTNNAAVSGIYTDVPYDLTVLLRLPCGLSALLYEQGDGAFIINCIDEALAANLLKEAKMPVVISEELPKPPTRTLHDAPADGLSPYTVLVPLPEPPAE